MQDEEKRARYDRYGHQGVGSNPVAGRSVNDIFDMFGDIFGGSGLNGSIFDAIFGGGSQTRSRGGSRGSRGSDLLTEIELELEDVCEEKVITQKIYRDINCKYCSGTGAKPGSKLKNCPTCGGHGMVMQRTGFITVQTTCPTCHGEGRTIADKCSHCGGSGTQKKDSEIEIHIPAGIDEGMRIRLTGEGNAGKNDGASGHLYVDVHVKEHDLFERDGSDLILYLPITYSQAVMGAKLDIPTLKSVEKLSIPAGSEPDKVIKLRNKGLPRLQSSGHGDLLVVLKLEIPKKPSKEHKKAIENLAEFEKKEISSNRKNLNKKLEKYLKTKLAESENS